MKNKIVKMMVLIILPVMFLTGCGNWEEDKEQYSDILNKGVSCIYSPAEKYKSDKFGIQTIKFSADNNGLFIKFNSNSPSEIYGPNGYKEKHEFGKNKFSIAQNVTQDFLNYYLEKNKCPEKIYIDGLQKHFSLEIISSFTEPIEYELGTSTVLTPENEERTCHHGSADDCRKMVKKITECSENGETIYIEYGYYDKSKKYFGISSNDNYTDIRIDEDDSDGFLVQFGNKKSNFVIREDAINDIWKSDNTLAPITEIVISCDVNMGRQYYISGKSSAPDEGGVIIDGWRYTRIKR